MNILSKKIKNLKLYNTVYKFSNENLASFKNIYKFKDAKVLTVIGSGDQYFTSLLNGAKDVEIFDKNETSYLFFILKFYAIKTLSYDEFFHFLKLKDAYNFNIYNKLSKVLPLDILKYYNSILETNDFFHNIDLSKKSTRKKYIFKDAAVIPYFFKSEYYRLQNILQNITIPNFNNCELLNITNKDYDLLLLSNIYDYLSLNVSEFKFFLEYLSIPQIQANYDWFEFKEKEFKSNGFDCNHVFPSPYVLREPMNYVYSLKKEK